MRHRLKRPFTHVFLMLCLSSILIHVSIFECSAQAGPATVSVSRSSITVNIGQSFSINIDILNVSDLYGWEFKLGWNASLLDWVSVEEGPFLKSGGNTFFTYNLNITGEHLIVDCTLEGLIPGVSGNGTLATVSFYAKSVGECPLGLYDVILLNSQEQQIDCNVVSGYARATLYDGHDIAVASLEASKTVLGQGYCANINATIEDYGIFAENFSVTVYANTTAIQTQTATLASGNSAALGFMWNSTGFDRGNYTISAYAWPVPGETETSDNTRVDGIVLVTIPGDVDGDHKVRIDDILAIAQAFGSNLGDPMYNPNLDITNQQKIRVDDILIAVQHFGQGPW
jgi:hypothetical protein